MKTLLTPLNTILLLGAVQGFILAAILTLKRRANRKANRILAGMLFFLSFAIVFHTLSHARIIPFLETHVWIIGIASVLVGPLLFLYVRILTTFDFKLNRTVFFHFIPFLFCLLLALLVLVSGSDSTGSLLGAGITVISFTVFGLYIILANLRLWSYSRTIKDNFSDIKKINLNWLRIFILLFTLFFLFAGIYDLLFKTESWDLIWLASCIQIYLISYIGLIQPVIFSGPVLETGAHWIKKNRKYQKSSLSNEMADRYLNQLQSMMKDTKRYLDKNISLNGLAQEMGVSIHHLSQVINERLGFNFYDFINSLRIGEAQRRLIDPRSAHLSIASIGFEVGFNSLSAFNSAFKKFTKLTPSQFRDQQSLPAT